ncbi:MAG: GatB/YqeY domain-containing protein [Acidobacteriota bacterium]
MGEKIQRDMVAAMKSKDNLRLDVLRGIKTALKLKEVERGRGASDDEALQVLQSLAKQRKDSIEQFSKGGRQDLVEREQAELAILESYLPAAPSAQEIRAVVQEVIVELEASSAKDLGKVMKLAMSRLSGKNVDGKVVNAEARAQLGA